MVLMIVLTKGMTHGFYTQYDIGDRLLRCLVAEKTVPSSLKV